MSRPRLLTERQYETDKLKELQPWTDDIAQTVYNQVDIKALFTMAHRWRETYSIAVNAIQERNKAELDLQREQSKISTSLTKLQLAEQDRDTCVRAYTELQQKYRDLLASGQGTQGAQLAEAMQRNAQLEAAIEQNRRASAQAQAKQAKLSRQNADLASQLQQAQELQTTNRDLQRQLEQAQAQQASCTQLAQQNSALTTQLQQQAQRIQEIEAKNTHQKSILSKARESYRQLQANLSTCKADLQTLATIRADLDECNASLDARSKSEQELQQQVQALQAQLVGIQTAPDCSAQDAELATLRERLADFSAALNEVVRKVEQLVGRVPKEPT
jgi:chromosome segregation ATPase